MHIKEKAAALETIKFEGRPGCKEARELYANWCGRIGKERRRLYENLHSADAVEGRMKYGFTKPLPIVKIIHDCELYGFYDFASRLASIKINIYDISSKEKARLYGKGIKPLMAEYRQRILPAIQERNLLKAQHEKENADWRQNFGFNKWKGCLCDMLGYIESPLSATKGDMVVLFPYAFEAYENVDEDWNYYSKAWHSAHGPKRTVLGREVRVYEWGKGRVHTIELAKWKPGFMIEVVAQVLGLKQPKVEKPLRKFQVSPWVDVKRSVKRDGTQFYHLTMGKYTVGVVAYDEQRDIHYHAATKEEAIAGLTKKIEKIEADSERIAMEGASLLTASKAHDLWGFCYPGMTEFANSIGLDIDGTYTVGQLREAVGKLTDRSVVRKYHRELVTAKIINYQ